MAEKIEKNDFIEFSYAGSMEEEDTIFDTNIESKAKEYNIYNPKASYKPIIVCIGQAQVMKGIDEFLIGKDTETTYEEVFIEAEKAFGKKSMKQIQMISMNHFKAQGLRPYPGLEVNVDNSYGVVKSLNGGRVIVDFNHPMASKDLIYDIIIGKKITDKKVMITTIIEQFFRIPKEIFTLEEENGIKLIFSMEVPSNIVEDIKGKIKELEKVDVNIIIDKTKQEKKE